MSNEEDRCFRCQELGHIVCHCLNVHCFECNEYGHIAIDCPDRISPSGMPTCCKRQHSNTKHCATKTGADIAGQDHSHTLTDIEVTIAIIHTEFILDHITDATTGELHNTITPALIVIAVTHHTRDHPHVEVHQLIPEMVAVPDHVHHINQL